jgi:hypothetical protein
LLAVAKVLSGRKFLRAGWLLWTTDAMCPGSIPSGADAPRVRTGTANTDLLGGTK